MIKFLIKGLLRDRSRSLFPLMMVATGSLLTVLMYTWINGIMNDMVDTNARFDTGYVKIMTKAYSRIPGQAPNDLALLGTEELLKKLNDFRPDMVWLPRIKFGGLLDIPDRNRETHSQGPVFGIAAGLFNPDSKDAQILNIRKSIVRGKYPEKPGEILISENFAQKLGVNIGDEATLLGSTMYGGMSMYNFKIAGTLKFGMLVADKSTVIVDINDARNALDMNDGASEILGFTKDMIYSDKEMTRLSSEFNAEFLNNKDEFSPRMLSLSQQGNLEEMVNMSETIGSLVVIIFVLAMSVVLWNAGLMNGIRRYGEIGIRLAMGEPKGRIYRTMIIESVFVGMAGSFLGTMIGLVMSYWFQNTGLDISKMMQKSTVLMSNVMRARVTATSYYIGFLPGVFASVLGTVFSGIGIYRRQTSQLFKELET